MTYEEQAEKLEEYDKLFDMMHAANMRGVEMWRAANPGNDLVLPDQGKLVEWLLSEIDRLRQRLGPVGLEVVEIDDRGHYVNTAVKVEIDRLRKGWLDQATRDAVEIVRLETELKARDDYIDSKEGR